VVCADCEAADETVRLVVEEDHGRAEAIVLDVTDGAAAAEAVRALVERHARLDILVNNAGITRDQLLVRLKPEDWQLVLTVNLTGAFNLTQAAAKVMMRQRSGRVVNVASVIGLMGNAGQCSYAAPRRADRAHQEPGARAGQPQRHVNAVAPGFIQTAMTAGLDDKQREMLLASVAIPRLGEPEDVARRSPSLPARRLLHHRGGAQRLGWAVHVRYLAAELVVERAGWDTGRRWSAPTEPRA